MTGNHSKLKNFVEKFIGTFRFGNDHFGAIMGYGDYVYGDNVISRLYYVEGLGHNMFSVGQFCDSDLEIAFRKHSCFVRDMNDVDLLKGSRSTNLYTISIDDMMNSSLVCLLSKASKINMDLKFEKDFFAQPVNLEKARSSPTNQNMKTPIWKFFIPFTWIYGTNAEYRFVIKLSYAIKVGLKPKQSDIFLKEMARNLSQSYVKYYKGAGIFHQKSVPRTPQQNSVVERRNHTLMEAARTMLIFSKAPMFLWAEAVATACKFTLSPLDVLQGFSFFLQIGFTLILATLDGLDVGLLGDVIDEDDG
ncbi:retrovirus-related pol polyprotein from transposon TNT 1-94 [Tanacetum coccineum]